MLSSSTYQALFASSPVAEVLLSPTPEPIILAVNKAFLGASSRSEEDLVGASLFAAMPANPADEGESGLSALRASLLKVIATGQPDALPLQRYPIRVPGPDGSESFEVRYWSAINVPIFDAGGMLACISHRTSDVTETKRLQDEVAGNLERQGFLLRLADRLRPLESAEGIVVAACELLCRHLGIARVQYAEVNPAGDTFTVRCEWTLGAMPAVRGTECLLGELGPQAGAALRRGEALVAGHSGADPRSAAAAGAVEAMGAGASVAIPVLKAGQLATILWLQDARPRHWTAGEVELAREVAERTCSAAERARTRAELAAQREASERDLTESNRRKDEFLAMLAHELRNPLAPISAAAELMGIAQLDEARTRRTSDVIRRQVTHMAGLLDDLLDVSRVTRGLITLDKTPQDLGSVIASAVEQVLPLIEAQQHRLRIELASEPVSVQGDQKRMVQILANLLNNAAKYTPAGGDITLQVEADEAIVRIHVRDTGIGICPDMQDRVFELFAQGERSADRSQGGLGLGLALVKSLAGLHGGTVGCHSDGLGKGTCFTVILPRLAEAAPAAAAPAQVEVARQAPRQRILVVDDNVDAAEMLRLLLEAAGHEVMVEYDATRGLESARLHVPDVALLDIGLPGMDGAEMARRLRGQGDTAGMLLIAVTGYGQEPDRKHALDAGFDHHLVKPVNLKTLMTLIESPQLA